MPSIFASEEANLSSNEPSNDNQTDAVIEDDAVVRELQSALQSQREAKRSPSLQTTGDAYLLCETLLDKQIAQGLVEKPAANAAIRGDSAARFVMLLLLNDPQRRRLYLKTASNPELWHRLRPLFGAPPYSFLRPEDAGGLRAGGFAKARANMTFDQHCAASIAQFGPGQFKDQHTREYRIVAREDDETAPIGTDFLTSASQLVLQVKVKKQTRAKKYELSKSIFKKQLFFPQPGETIVLEETKSMLSAIGAEKPKQTVLKVRGLYPRGEGASTATITLVR